MGKDKKKRRDDSDDEREARKAAKAAKNLGYSNDVNPFGDSNLLQPFVWGKKKEKDKKEGKRESSSDKRLELIDEVDKLRQRRKQREDDVAEAQRLRDEEQRLKEAAQLGDWMSKEEEFLLEQTKERSKIRLLEKREKPIDVIAKNFILIDAAETKIREARHSGKINDLLGLDVEMRNPMEILEAVSTNEYRGLMDEIDAYIKLEEKKQGPHVKFWQSLLAVVKHLRRESFGEQTSLLRTIQSDAKTMLKNKSLEELKELVKDIEKNLKGGKCVDVEYWEAMLGEVQFQVERAYVEQVHASLVRQQQSLLDRLYSEGKLIKQERVKEEEAARSAAYSSSRADATGQQASIEQKLIQALQESGDLEENESEETMQARDEFPLPAKKYSWEQQYTPRKPRYFNRIKSGFDWNKYNQTHYDADNPPPKLIQGYKFTIFYPELADPSKAPRYFLEPCPDSKEFLVLRFQAGAPYEDIAFKIPNREWDTWKRSGFMCVFDKGALQLHFSFRRVHYRR